jgi:hypothetical protein
MVHRRLTRRSLSASRVDEGLLHGSPPVVLGPSVAMLVILLGTWLVPPLPAQSDSAAAQTPLVLVTDAPIALDGHPVEPVWFQADSITVFTQREPNEGEPVSERTVVRFLARPDGLYIGFWGYDQDPGAIRHAQLRRDADFESDDSFYLLLDPQESKRSGYIFAVNPNGAIADGEIIKVDDANYDWDGVWDARAVITGEGWFAEIAIPWSTVRYRLGASEWGVNVRRFLRRTNQEALWKAYKRQEGLLFQQDEGALGGFESLQHRSHAELRPYLAGVAQMNTLAYDSLGGSTVVDSGGAELRVGGDLRVAVTPTLTSDFTVNTDFAQVDADQQLVNLTRFALFFPEKRPFFLEGAGIFNLGQEERNLLFYSRRIGLDDRGETVPLVAGARLQGRAGHRQVGLLLVRTGGTQDATDAVARIKQDVMARGYVGAMLTGQTLPGEPGQLGAGLDTELPFIVGGQNLTIAAYATGTRDSAGARTGGSWRLLIDYPNDWSDDFFAISQVSGAYDPALGFVLERDVWRHTAGFTFYPRPHLLGIRRLILKPIEWDVTHFNDGPLSHAFYEITPLGAEWQTGDEFEFNLQREQDDPRVPFEIFPGSVIPASAYTWQRAQLQFSSSAGRAVGVEMELSTGGFYNGTATQAGGEVRIRLEPHIIAALSYTHDAVQLPTGNFTAREAGARLDLAANPRLNGTLFVQWDNESNNLGVNARIHWIPKPGTDAFLVWTSGWTTGLEPGVRWSRPQNGALVGKFVYYFVL